MRRSVFRGVAASMLVVTMATVAACGGGDGGSQTADASGQGAAALVTAAKKEGAVTVYWELPPPSQTAMKAAFEKKYPGINVSIAQSNQAVMLPKLDAEIDNKLEGADVVVNTAKSWIETHAKSGDFRGIDNLPDSALWSKNTSESLDATYARVGSQVFGLAWNSKEVQKPLTSLKDLTRPEFKGQIGTFDVLAPLVALYYDRIAAAVGGPDQLSAQGPWRLYSSTGPMLQALATGEIKVVAFVGPPAVEAAKKQGQPIEWAVPTEASGSDIFGAVLKNGRHVNAGKLFMSFVLSPEGQAIISADGNAVSPLGSKLVPDSPDVKVDVLDPTSLDAAGFQKKTQEYKKIFLG